MGKLSVTRVERGRIERAAPFRVRCGATLDCQLHSHLFDTGQLTYKPTCLPLSLFLRLSQRDSRAQLLNTNVVPRFLQKYHENYYHHHCYYRGCTAKKQTQFFGNLEPGLETHCTLALYSGAALQPPWRGSGGIALFCYPQNSPHNGIR